MPSTISAGTTAGSAIAITGDTTGNLAFQTNGTTTAMTIDTSQNVAVGTTTALATASGRGNITINGSSGSILSFGTGGSLRSYIFQDPTTMYVTNSSTGPINFEANGVQGMSISAAGRVTMPFQPAFHVRVNNGAYLTTSPIPFSNAVFDIGSNFNTSTYRFTAPVAGRYAFMLIGYGRITSGGGNVVFTFRVNNSSRQYHELVAPTATTFLSLSGQAIFNLSTGDFVDIAFTGGSGTYFGGNAETNFFGWLIG